VKARWEDPDYRRRRRIKLKTVWGKRRKKRCELCRKTFEKDRTKRFCSESCAAKWRWQQKEIRDKILNHPNRSSEHLSKKIKEAHKKNPQLAKNSSDRMKRNNPTKDPKVVKKIKETWKKNGGHPLKRQQLKGGNGRPLPKAQRILYAALYPDWRPELPIPTKQKRGSGYPSNYKVDLAHKTKKLYIEVDGWSHSMEEKKQQDKKKEALLTRLGWKGLRFTNQEIMENLEEVLKKVQQFTT
jgi:hypothetical protein